MTKVYPTPIIPVAVSPTKSSAPCKNPEVFTIWKKSLLFNCDGFTVFDSNGNLVFRVDNYIAGGNGEIVLMDASGRPLLTIRHKRLSLSDSWQVYDGETIVNPLLSVKKHRNVFHTKSLAYVCKEQLSKNNNTRIPVYEIDGSYAQRCCVIYDDTRRNVAEIKRKDAKGGTVALGIDVFRLVVQPLIDPSLAMALVIILDQMFGTSRVNDGSGLNFSGSFRRKVGDGSETRFWKDRWLGDSPLETVFPRISRLVPDLKVSILERGGWVADSWVWNWSWSRDPRGRALGELQNLEMMLDGWKPCREKKDSWEWELDKNKGFSVQKLREILADREEAGVGETETVWLPIVPKKVNVFLWRLRLGRIPTRVALDNMGVDLDSCLCPRCGLEVEDFDHAFLKCGEVKLLWSKVGKWWNKPLTGIDSVVQFLQEDADLVRTFKGKAWWVGVKWVFLYLLWSHRNRLVFHNDKIRLDECFYKWQRLAFEWISNKSKGVHLDWFAWLSGAT
ncbi:hypothetical protein OSB04_020104 [Centaurea solstitialis]|uniref:Reverse transcriptase zinc-binding domain-containing protein n=1 Tax=Centaurea solstitialis TaxID=347529 RepID=A0AA38T500_9ASTR|nr:hypothetical protein OSB04_020104 [Centaurea solstitialis]